MKIYKKIRNQEKGRAFLLSAMTGLSLAAVLFFSASCGDDPVKETETERYLRVNPKTVDFQNTGGKRSVTVTTDIEDWSFSVDDASWVTATSDGNVIELTAKPNPDTDRMTYLRLTSVSHSSENKVLEVRQGPTHLTITPEEVELDALSDYTALTVATNIEDWTYSLDPTDASEWLTVVKDGDELQLSVWENTPGGGDRSANLIVRSAEFNLEKIVEVTQRAQDVYLTIVPDSPVEFEANGGEVTVAVTSNLDTWTYSLDPADAADWLAVEKEGNELKLTAGENTAFTPRSVTLKIVIAQFDIEETLVLTQKDQSPYLELGKSAVNIKPGGETVAVSVSTNIADWTYIVDPVVAEDWLTVVQEDGELKLTAGENPEAVIRTATVTVNAGTLQETIAVSQKTVPVYTQNITATYLKNTGPTFTRVMDGTTPVPVPLPEGSTLAATRFFYITDWITNEAGRINGNWDNTLGQRLCMSGINTGGNPPSQFQVNNGKIYQTVTLPAGRYKFDYHMWHKNNNSINVCLVVDVGDDLPDIGPWVANVNQYLGDIPNALAYIEVPYDLNINQGNPATVYELEFDLDEETTVSMGFVANSRNQMLFSKFELWAE